MSSHGTGDTHYAFLTPYHTPYKFHSVFFIDPVISLLDVDITHLKVIQLSGVSDTDSVLKEK